MPQVTLQTCSDSRAIRQSRRPVSSRIILSCRSMGKMCIRDSLCTDPVVRIRREDEEYYLTYKGRGLLAREEYNLPLNEEAYRHLLEKADGIHIEKRRYRIPLTNSPHLTAELDIFAGAYQGLKLVEVEFPSLEEAGSFIPPEWFGEDVTLSGEYQNSRLANPPKKL